MPDQDPSQYEDEGPWTEEQWEQFMRQSDVRTAKYGELLETLKDHPDQDAIIDREMGWDQEDEVDEEWQEFLESLDTEPDEEVAAHIEAKENELKSMPVYQRSYAFGMMVHNALKPYVIEDQEEQDEDVAEARVNAFTIAAKLRGGHAMGYDDQALGGNVVCCKRSLEAAENCLSAIGSLRDREVLPADAAAELLAEGTGIRDMVAERVEELRSRMWWQR